MTRAGRREHKTETDHERRRRACRRHLKDLQRAHLRPPPDVAIRPGKAPVRLSGTGAVVVLHLPGALCAELIS